eukprot:TRINITY_DN6608_c0_g1_i1.p1 TRINITY_DN6608_c0_g1~~TRINITY_DN6608_c0_g1_i1.p1  ORF type:complete len:1106 (+),score=262.52 TRINITY_DN6608_c0_g1_i1:101-3418(+)
MFSTLMSIAAAPGAAEFAGSALKETHSEFLLCCALATTVGLALTLVDESGGSHLGSGPIAHVGECADSAYALFGWGAFADGGGLGILDPLRELFAKRPNGFVGLGGFLAVTQTLFSVIFALVTSASDAVAFMVGKTKSKPRTQSKTPCSSVHEKIKMSFSVELANYIGYLYLVVVGVAREYIVRILAKISNNPVYKQYVSRERWVTGWVDFYLNHCYADVVECFQRPIASAPDASVDVVRRVRRGGTLFGPLYKYEMTETVKTCINLSSYNYLGFGGIDTFCTPAARKVALDVGYSSGGTRSEGGTMSVHRELENEVAEFLQKEDALVLGMGFASNSTILPALFEAQAGGSGMLVLSDELNHRSIVEGVRLSGATVRAFQHNNMEKLEEELKKAVEQGQGSGKPWRKIFIVVEGIYSMEGDFCRLREIVTLKNRYKAFLYLDEAHSIGAVGPRGRGVTDKLGVPTSEVEVMMGTFTKSFGSAGGYVAASKEVIDALRKNAPGSLFASAMAPPCAAQALAAFRVIAGKEGGDVGARKLAAIKDNANFFRQRLEEEGFKILGDVDSPIIPTMIHHPQKMKWFSQMCLERGIAVVIVGYPAVPLLYERVRFCISAAHTREQLSKALNDMTEIGRELGMLFDKAMDKADLAARAKRDAEYNEWLHKAPMQCRGEADIAPEAVNWSPEAIVPKTTKNSQVAEAHLKAIVSADEHHPLDVRRFDPLGYVAKPSETAQRAIASTMDTYGFGACGPRGFYGTTKPHLELEQSIKDFLGVDSAIVYSAGAVTISSVLPALVQPGDRVIVDKEASLGVNAGLRLCKAKVFWVSHNDPAAVDATLSKLADAAQQSAKSSSAKSEENRTFIVVEALNQRTGSLAPLAELVSLKEKYGALLVLDETLSFGTLGANGRGLCELLDVSAAKVDAIVGSLEHAIANVGGFCAGRLRLVEHQRLAGAGYCFSAASPPSSCSAAKAVIEELAGEVGADKLRQLRANSQLLHAGLKRAVKQHGVQLELTSDQRSFMQHLRWTGDALRAEAVLLDLAERCFAESGVRLQVCVPGSCHAEAAFGERIGAPAFSSPSIRLCTSAAQTVDDVDAVCRALSAAMATTGM